MASKKNKPQDAAKEPEQVEQTEEQTETKPETVTMTQEELETVKKHIDELQKKLDDTVALLQRNQADFDNFRKRNASVRADSYDEGKRDCIKSLLPVLDDFDRVAESDANAEGWADGVKLALPIDHITILGWLRLASTRLVMSLSAHSRKKRA